MDKYLSCDWGTSSFRLRLVEASSMKVVCAVAGAEGIAVTYQRWFMENRNESERLSFFQVVLIDQIKKLAFQAGADLQGLPLVMSGMASSSIGMKELPYREIPFKIDGSNLVVETSSPSEFFPHQLIIISGAKTNSDVLRGEETLVAGSEVPNTTGESIYIFPGTHSKHLRVVNGEAVGFKTYLTGELFDLLSTKSILANSVERTKLHEARFDDSFSNGIRDGLCANFLNIVFHVRTNQLFKKNTPSENYHYLSGLLIGSELKDLNESIAGSIVLVAGESLRRQYELGLRLLTHRRLLQFVNAEEALVRGQLRIWQAMQKHQ